MLATWRLNLSCCQFFFQVWWTFKLLWSALYWGCRKSGISFTRSLAWGHIIFEKALLIIAKCRCFYEFSLLFQSCFIIWRRYMRFLRIGAILWRVSRARCSLINISTTLEICTGSSCTETSLHTIIWFIRLSLFYCCELLRQCFM